VRIHFGMIVDGSHEEIKNKLINSNVAADGTLHERCHCSTISYKVLIRRPLATWSLHTRRAALQSQTRRSIRVKDFEDDLRTEEIWTNSILSLQKKLAYNDVIHTCIYIHKWVQYYKFLSNTHIYYVINYRYVHCNY